MQGNLVSPFTSPFSSPFRVLVMSDNVMIKFGGKGKAKKLFKGIIEFPAPTDADTPNLLEHTLSPCKPKSPSKSKSPLKMSVQPAAKKQKLGPDKLKSG